MSDLRPRGLGRGLSSLLGEPVKTETPRPANAPTWSAPEQPHQRAPIEPPRNVFELPVPHVPAPQTTASAPSGGTASEGPRSIPIDLVQRNPGQPRKHFDD